MPEQIVADCQVGDFAAADGIHAPCARARLPLAPVRADARVARAYKQAGDVCCAVDCADLPVVFQRRLASWRAIKRGLDECPAADCADLPLVADLLEAAAANLAHDASVAVRVHLAVCQCLERPAADFADCACV